MRISLIMWLHNVVPIYSIKNNGHILPNFKHFYFEIRFFIRISFSHLHIISLLDFNDNLTSVLLAWPAILPVLPLVKFNFDILVLQKDLYWILLLSVIPIDAAQQKKKMKFGWLGAEIWEIYSGRYCRQDITLVKLSLNGSPSFWSHSKRNFWIFLEKMKETSEKNWRNIFKENLRKY